MTIAKLLLIAIVGLGTIAGAQTPVPNSPDAVNGVQLKALEVISVRRAGDAWKLLLSGELEGMAAAIAAQP